MRGHSRYGAAEAAGWTYDILETYMRAGPEFAELVENGENETLFAKEQRLLAAREVNGFDATSL